MNKTKDNKTSGFWIRLLARLIDTFVFAFFSTILAYFLITNKESEMRFSQPWMFYLWGTTSAGLLLLIFIFCPLFFNGQTTGMFLLRIKIVFKNTNQKILSLFKRELPFSLAWVFNLLILLTIINHSLIGKLLANQQTVVYSSTESIRVAFLVACGSFVFLIQWIFTFSVMFRKNKRAFHDQFSDTKTVYKNRFETAPKQEQVVCFQPFMINNQRVEWVQDA